MTLRRLSLFGIEVEEEGLLFLEFRFMAASFGRFHSGRERAGFGI
jgi:hypothetical protein